MAWSSSPSSWSSLHYGGFTVLVSSADYIQLVQNRLESVAFYRDSVTYTWFTYVGTSRTDDVETIVSLRSDTETLSVVTQIETIVY